MTTPTSSPVALDPLRLPLHGRRLIEASAGTGKTWTIAALYVRLVLGHGAKRPLLPPEILAITFTDAATKELRSRIRERLVEAARCFDGGDGDDFLIRLRDDFDDEQRDLAAQRLHSAAQWMDDAAIHTIHGWCQRMLARHALASNATFDAELEAGIDELTDEAVRDWWRRHVYPLSAKSAQAVLGLWETPDALLKALRPLLRASEALIDAGGEPLQAPEDWNAVVDEWVRWRSGVDAIRDEAQQSWWAHGAEAVALLRQAALQRRINARSYTEKNVASWSSEMTDWCEGGEIPKKALERFSAAHLVEAATDADSAPRHPFFDAVQSLHDANASEPKLTNPTLAHVLAFVREQVELCKRQLAVIGFDDLLSRLDVALQGPGGEALAAAIRSELPFAMVDEFQDTDPCQYRILRAIWPDVGHTDGGLFLIGDPKQAIYAFRNADIHTYLRASRDALQPASTLATNHRSSKAMVDAVNRLFSHGEESAADGAFAFPDNVLPFHPVQAQGRRERWLVDGQQAAAMTLWHLPSEVPLSKGNYQAAMAEHGAAGIAALLRGDRTGFYEAGVLTPLREADIAVLVRDYTEAALIRDALARRGLRSVYLSDRDVVFNSPEAVDLLRWLRACADPGSDRLVRAALATASLGFGYDELDRLNDDEPFRETIDQRFRELHDIGRQRGVLAMLTALLHDFDVPRRMLRRAGGERSLTNLLHLAELLQHESTRVHGEQALIRWLAQAIVDRDASGQGDDPRVLRLESDAGLIRVVTIHKSKGLEYPLVFLPFVCAIHETRAPWKFHRNDGAHIELSRDEKDARRDAERDAMQENLRLLYVAVTRARHGCWLGVASTRLGKGKDAQLEKTAFGHLLAGGEPIAHGTLQSRLEALVGDGRDGIVVETLPEAPSVQPATSEGVSARESGQPTLLAARKVSAAPPASWWIASYSALALADADHAPRASADTPREDVINEIVRDAASADPSVGSGIHRFPQGAEPGTFLHGLFEVAADEGFADCVRDSAALRRQIAKRCERRGWQAWFEPLARWLPQLLRTPIALPEGGHFTLAGFGAGDYRAELEFWIEAHGVDTRRLDALVTAHTQGGEPRLTLQPDRINGLFKGFIDLVFVHDGRWYVLDYKSNRLGDDDAAYSADAMRRSVLDHRYDLQYTLYLLALHRQLKARLPGYDPARHLGGAVYLYLRGVDAAGHGVHVERPPVGLIERIDALFANGGGDAG